MIERRLLLTAAAAALGTASLPVRGRAEPAWPSKPLRVIVGFSAGSTPDLIARTIGDPLSQLIGQPVVVEDKPGASGNIAAAMVAEAHDEHTVGAMINLNLTIAHILNPDLAYDPRRDLAPICLVGTTPFVLAISPKWAKQKAGLDQLRAAGSKLNYGSVGIGSMAHLGMELLADKLGIKPTHVPYPGNPKVLAALAANEIDLAFIPAGITMQQVRAGTVGALAIASAKRSELAPGVPTLAELGVPDVEIEGWVAIAVSAHMAEAHRKKLETLTLEVLNTPEVRKQLTRQGWDVAAMPSAAFTHRLEAETAMLSRIIKAQNIHVN
jgi:tripartite-type tricarboxylate transporter receptor subunit TctC